MIITLCGEKKIWLSIKKSQNITSMIVVTSSYRGGQMETVPKKKKKKRKKQCKFNIILFFSLLKNAVKELRKGFPIFIRKQIEHF